MPADMKETIAQAARTLLMTHRVKKLTVKDLVEQCHITRQTFYYHFADIPELFRWMLERQTEQMLREIQSKGDPEEGLRYFFAMASQLAPHIQRGMDSSYRAELEPMLRQYLQRFFFLLAENRQYYAQCSVAEVKIISRYHSLAVLGLLQEWTPQDAEQLDQIVHIVYHLMTDGIPPQG